MVNVMLVMYGSVVSSLINTDILKLRLVFLNTLLSHHHYFQEDNPDFKVTFMVLVMDWQYF